jgi:guanylate kinase
MLSTSKGKIIIITAPSGAGKTSITHHLLQHFPQLKFSVSAATRLPRGKEVDGVDYHFMSAEAFQQKIQEEAFVEWEMVYEGKYYGTLKSEVERLWQAGNVPLLDIDVKGAIHVQQQYRTDSLSIFIQAPSIDELRNRLQKRGTDSEANIEVRISKAAYEMSFINKFDATIINDDLATAQKQAIELVGKFLEK